MSQRPWILLKPADARYIDTPVVGTSSGAGILVVPEELFFKEAGPGADKLRKLAEENICEQPREQPKPLTAKVFYEALIDAGIIQRDTARVVIDLNRGELVMHIEQYPDTRLLNLVQTLDGIEISRGDDET